MKKFKLLTKILAAALAAATIFCCTSCKDTTWAVKAGDDTLPAGVYLGFLLDAYYSAANSASSSNTDLFSQKIEGVDAADYIKNIAMENSKKYITVERLFEKYELSFTEDETKEFNDLVDSYWGSIGSLYEENGCGKQSFSKMLLMDEKYNKIFNYYYSEKGKEPVSEEDRKEYFTENYAKIKYINIQYSAHFDGVSSSADATDKQKNELKALAEKYVSRLKDGENIDKLIAEEEAFSAEKTETEEDHDHDHEHEEEQEVAYTFLTKDTADEPDAFNAAVFAAKTATPTMKENSTYGYYVFVRYKTDAETEDYTERAEGVLSNMKQEDFTEIVEKAIKEIKFTENKSAVKRFKPQNITINM